MHIESLFFAAYRDLIGESRVVVELPDASTVSELVVHLRRRGPPFDALPSDPAVAVNQGYARGTTRLAPGDEVAFIPPVAGG